jgi:parvulin-like peptidyl-prolyl isomerase
VLQSAVRALWVATGVGGMVVILLGLVIWIFLQTHQSTQNNRALVEMNSRTLASVESTLSTMQSILQLHQRKDDALEADIRELRRSRSGR